MNPYESTGGHVPAPRRSRWSYWVFVPICGVTYTLFCTWFMLEAWERMGEPKPGWFYVAFAFACPGMFVVPIPFVGPLLVGMGSGFLLVWLAQQSSKRSFVSPARS
jgi:hypothetical protein